MTITLLLIGKTEDKALEGLISDYVLRLKHYVKLNIVPIPYLKNTKSLSENQQKSKEGKLILKHIGPFDHLILLDEKGKQYTSVDFSGQLQKKMNSGLKNLVFAIGGAYGFDDTVKQRGNMEISLSKMTFPHQMIRLIFIEQIYRAFTILRNEPYHHR